MARAAKNREPRLLEIVTPEKLPLRLAIAPVSERIAAFALDLVILVVVTLVVALPLVLLATLFDLRALVPTLAVFLLVQFVLWNGYFLYFELRWQGVTPGKRQQGLRVVSRDGGPLTTGAVFARNLMRDLELYLPLQAFCAPELLFGEAPGLARLVASGWLFVFLFLPLFNRERARAGDLVAGTLVIRRPVARLLEDPAAAEVERGPSAPPRYVFSPEQLDMYGIRELQILENLLRRWQSDEGPGVRDEAAAIRVVYDKITAKIAWREPVPSGAELPFLREFYRAQRARLEHRLLLGERRERKREGRLNGE